MVYAKIVPYYYSFDNNYNYNNNSGLQIIRYEIVLLYFECVGKLFRSGIIFPNGREEDVGFGESDLWIMLVVSCQQSDVGGRYIRSHAGAWGAR